MISSSMIANINKGYCVSVDETQHLRKSTWKERLVRIIPGRALEQDQQVAKLLIQHIAASKKDPNQKESLEAASTFLKRCGQTSKVFKNLENLLFAHKCNQILSVPVKKLVNNDGTPKSSLISIIKSNHLHHVIRKADDSGKETAILFGENHQVFIRSKTGKNFLETPQEIAYILTRLPKNHPDHKPLKRIKSLLSNGYSTSDCEVLSLCKKLESSHYNYSSLSDVQVDKKGILSSQMYMAEGLETHDKGEWSTVKSSFKEKSDKPTYKLRVVTRLPDYSLAKTWSSFIFEICRHIFDVTAHGHSWVQLVEPEYNSDNNFTNKQKVTDFGFYLRKKFFNTDPYSYLPLPANKIDVQEMEIDEETFKKGILYINEAQVLMKNPDHPLHAVPQNKTLSDEAVEKITFIYKAAMKGTCLSFANSFKEALTGIRSDSRSWLRRKLLPKNSYNITDRLDRFMDHTILLQRIFKPLSMLSRAELPFFQRKAKTAPKPSSE